MKLKLHSIYSGHCQVNYSTRNEQNQIIYYGFQEYDKNKMRFMRLSQDGEPQCEAWPKENALIYVEKPTEESRLVNVLIEYIESHANFTWIK